MPNWAKNHSEKIIRRLDRDIFPWLGKRPIREITAPNLLTVLRRIEGRALETAHRALQNCGQSFRYAIAAGRAKRDISADLKVALPPAKLGHFAAVTDPKKIGSLLRAIDAFEGTFPVKCTLKLAPLVFIRPGELRTAGREHIDLDRAEWCYTVTKTNAPRVLPLSMHAGEIFKELHPLTGHGCCAFPISTNPKRRQADVRQWDLKRMR